LFEYSIYYERKSRQTKGRNEENGKAVQQIKTLFNCYGRIC
jgi:hypothetical protein